MVRGGKLAGNDTTTTHRIISDNEKNATWNVRGREGQSGVGGHEGTHILVDSYSLSDDLVDLYTKRKVAAPRSYSLRQ